jgi:ribosome-associated protein
MDDTGGFGVYSGKRVVSMIKRMGSQQRIELFVQAALGKKAQDVIVLDVGNLTSIADFFIICSGRSNRQVGAIADHIERSLKDQKIKPLSVEGKNDGHWVLMDYGDVIIHVFFEETRRFYDLEGLWVDARRMTTESLEIHRQHTAESFDGDEIIVE